LELNGAAPATATAGAAALLQRIGLGERADAFPDQLSGGEQQRVAVARALVHRPALVLADEPTGNLDVRSGRQVLDLLDELSAEHGHGLLIVTHSLAVAERAHRVLTLVDGRLSETTEHLAW
jgi:putative ABC transport system ATP-binding protein